MALNITRFIAVKCFVYFWTGLPIRLSVTYTANRVDYGLHYSIPHSEQVSLIIKFLELRRVTYFQHFWR